MSSAWDTALESEREERLCGCGSRREPFWGQGLLLPLSSISREGGGRRELEELAGLVRDVLDDREIERRRLGKRPSTAA